MIIILPITRVCHDQLKDLEDSDYGSKILDICLTGFLSNMLVNNFDLNSHLFDVDYIDGLYGSECTDIKQKLKSIIARMTINYRGYFSGRRYRDVKIRRATYTRGSLRFVIEVTNVRR